MLADAPMLLLYLMNIVAVGALAGFGAGLMRTGGGILLAPALMIAFDGTPVATPVAAVGTALAANTLLSLRAVIYHAQHQGLMRGLSLRWGAAVALGGAAGGLLAVSVAAPWVQGGLGAMLVAAGLILPVRDGLRPLARGPGWLAAPLGAGLGAASAFGGIGGGTFIGAAWRWLGLPNPAGHGAVCGVALGVTGLVPLMLLGEAAAPLAIGAVGVPGAVVLAWTAALVSPFGARVAAEGPAQILLWALAFTTLSMGFALLRAAVAGG